MFREPSEEIVSRSLIVRLALVIALAVFAAACGSSGSDEETTQQTATTAAPEADSPDEPSGTDASDDPPEPEADVELFDSYEGVTADTIKLGAVITDLDELRELGLVDINQGDRHLIYETLVAHLNANGGVLGRQVELIAELYNPVFNASAEEACVKLTRDENVFAVLGGVAGPARDSIACFIDTNETIVIGGTHTPAHLEAARAPWIAMDTSGRRRYEATIGLYHQEGLLDGVIGVIDDSSEHESITVDVVVPAIEALGYEVKTQVTSNVPQGDEVALAQQISVLAERLKQDNIDTLVVVQSQIALGLALVREAGYEGRVLTADAGVQLNTIGSLDERDPAIYDGAYGAMGLSNDEVWELPETQECVSRFTDAHPDIDVLSTSDVQDGEPDWLIGLLAPCRYLDTFKLIAEAAGADLNPESFLAAAKTTGSFSLAARPFNSLGEGKLDADDGLRLGIFDSTAGPSGSIVPITDFQDIG
jgi:hypothetical protein